MIFNMWNHFYVAIQLVACRKLHVDLYFLFLTFFQINARHFHMFPINKSFPTFVVVVVVVAAVACLLTLIILSSSMLKVRLVHLDPLDVHTRNLHHTVHCQQTEKLCLELSRFKIPKQWRRYVLLRIDWMYYCHEYVWDDEKATG